VSREVTLSGGDRVTQTQTSTDDIQVHTLIDIVCFVPSVGIVDVSKTCHMTCGGADIVNIFVVKQQYFNKK